MSHRHQASIPLVALAALSGCGDLRPEPVSETAPLTRVSGALAAYSGSFTLWDTQNNVVNICWVTAGLATEKNQVRDGVNAAWGAFSGLTFNWPANPGTDVCPTVPGQPTKVPSNYMPIQINVAGSYGGQCNAGVGARLSQTTCGNTATECECFLNTGFNEPNPTAALIAAALHEIGHGLGLPHEHQRVDRPSDIQATCVDPNPDPNKWTDNGNYTVDSTYRLLTPYDGLKSIMSYCRDWDENGRADVPPFLDLSAMDELGIEMLYPKSLGRRPTLPGAMTNAGGSQAIVRSDQTYSVMPDWVARGGLTNSLSGFQWADQNLSVFSTQPTLSLSFSSSRTIQLRMTDTLGRVHPFTPVSVVPNNALFTAIGEATVISL